MINIGVINLLRYFLKGIPTTERLKGVPTTERLKGIPRQVIEEYLSQKPDKS